MSNTDGLFELASLSSVATDDDEMVRAKDATGIHLTRIQTGLGTQTWKVGSVGFIRSSLNR